MTPVATTFQRERLVTCHALLVYRDARGGVHRRGVAVYAPEDLAATAALGEVLSPSDFAELVDETTARFAKSELGKVYQDAGGSFRWITVKPHGDDQPGVPVKIRESKTAPGTWHVVGGAGGKLNYLRLTGVKSPQEYREQAQQKRKARDERKQATLEEARARRDDMTEEERQADREAARRKVEVLEARRTEARTQRQELVARVAEKLGWADDEWQFDATRERLQRAGASAERIEKVEAQHHKRVYQRALDALRATKRYLLADPERAKLVLAGAPLATDDPAKVGLTDVLERERAGTGKGFKSPTREKSDANLRAAVATQTVDALRSEYQEAAERSRVAGGDDPQLAAAAEDARKQLHMAELLQEAQTRAAGDVEQERTALSRTLADTRAAMNDYLGRLQELRTERAAAQGGDVPLSPEHAALEQRAYEDAGRVEAMTIGRTTQAS